MCLRLGAIHNNWYRLYSSIIIIVTRKSFLGQYLTHDTSQSTYYVQSQTQQQQSSTADRSSRLRVSKKYEHLRGQIDRQADLQTDERQTDRRCWFIFQPAKHYARGKHVTPTAAGALSTPE